MGYHFGVHKRRDAPTGNRKEGIDGTGRQLKAKREERGLSQDEVSKAIFVSRQTISNWENDKTYPDVQSLLLLSQLFDVSIDELVRGDVVAIQRAIAEDSRKMRLLSIGMLAFSGLAFLFLLASRLRGKSRRGSRA